VCEKKKGNLKKERKEERKRIIIGLDGGSRK